MKNETKAQKELYDLYSRKMYGVCKGYSNSREDTNDIMQEAFLKVFRSLNKYDNKGSIGGWIRRIFVNTAIDFYRQSEREIEVISIDPEVEENVFVAQESYSNIDYEHFITLMQQLPEKARLVFNLFNIEGYSHKEIAVKMGISEGTSKSQYSRARQLLKIAIVNQGML
ncbi:MAG: sigma-70 family RNA polymerase sigma factor [Flavobacteriales bacterium]|nr:sigma-70 family RNA polymerase sigma factor [Flavobacteriales bacterium]